MLVLRLLLQCLVPCLYIDMRQPFHAPACQSLQALLHLAFYLKVRQDRGEGGRWEMEARGSRENKVQHTKVSITSILVMFSGQRNTYAYVSLNLHTVSMGTVQPEVRLGWTTRHFSPSLYPGPSHTTTQCTCYVTELYHAFIHQHVDSTISISRSHQ